MIFFWGGGGMSYKQQTVQFWCWSWSQTEIQEFLPLWNILRILWDQWLWWRSCAVWMLLLYVFML